MRGLLIIRNYQEIASDSYIFCSIPHKIRFTTENYNQMQQCSICYSIIQIKAEINSCRHKFCFQCISEWAKIQNTCPICKKRFNKISKLLPTTSQSHRTDTPTHIEITQNQDSGGEISANIECTQMVDTPKKVMRPEEQILADFLIQATQNFNMMVRMSRELDQFQKQIFARMDKGKQKKLKKQSK